MTSEQRPATVKVVVATTVMLSFISFWRAAAIVLSDLASSAYYVGGIAEQAIGKAAPWFILAIMLFSYAVRAVYIESCSMFVRGGVYRVVHEAMGGTLAKFSVSALMFDYVLTGPKMDIVVLSVRLVTQAGSGEHALESSQLFSEDETNVFTRVVTLAEKAGKHVELMVVPGSDPYQAVADGGAVAVVAHRDGAFAESDDFRAGRASGALLGQPASRGPPSARDENQKDVVFFNLGPHPPRLWPEDIELAHRLWLALSGQAPAPGCTAATSSGWRCAVWPRIWNRTVPRK